MSSKVLVTGASGFVGSRLVLRLIKQGYDVAITLRPGSTLSELGVPEELLYKIDVDNSTTAVALADKLRDFKPDAVVHLASLYISEHEPHQIESLVLSNVLFGTQLLEAMAQAGCPRLVNIGTSWQYYESDSYRPVNLYAATKQAFIDVAKYYLDARGLRVIDLKLYDTYGENDRRKKLVPYLVDNLGSSSVLSLSEGRQLINIVHIDDVVNCLVIALERMLNDKVNGYEEYQVSAEETLTLRELVELLEDVSHQTLDIAWGARPYRDREVMQPWRGGSLLPGWQQEITLREGLLRVVSASRKPAPINSDYC